MTDDENRADDPGWQLDWRAMLPFVQLAHFRRSTGDALPLLRSVCVSFCISLVLFGVIVPTVLPFGDGSGSLTAVGLLAVAVASYFAEPRMERPPRCGSDEVLLDDFRTRFFLRIAMATSVALIAFCAAFVTNCSWIYFVGLLFAAPGLARAAPTRAALAREQDPLDRLGCDGSLISALRRSRSE